VSATLVGMATRHQVEANLRLLQAITDRLCQGTCEL